MHKPKITTLKHTLYIVNIHNRNREQLLVYSPVLKNIVKALSRPSANFQSHSGAAISRRALDE